MPTVPTAPQALLSYRPSKLALLSHERVHYAFAANGLTLPLYFALKGKHGYRLDNREQLVCDIRSLVEAQAANVDFVVFPESRFPFLKDVTVGLSHRVELRKRNKLEVCQRAQESAKWNREARHSQQAAWAEMGESFTINKVKSNQRKHYVPFLFEATALPAGASVLMLDDFIMSGNTLAAMRAAVVNPDVQVLGIFYQLDSADKLSRLLPM